MIFHDVTTGASNDLKKATRLARDMVTRYGMSEEIGAICYEEDDEEVFLGKDLARERSYGEETARRIDAEVKKIMDMCYSKAETILKDNRDILDASADLLLKKEKIGRDEFEALFTRETVG